MTKAIKIKEFPDDDRLWRIDWLAYVQRNEKNIVTESTIDVYLSPVQLINAHDFSKGDRARICRQIGVGQLPLLTIGSLWHNSQLSDEKAIRTPTKLPPVFISPSTVRLIAAGFRQDGHYVIDKSVFHIGGYKNGLSAHCLAVEHNGDPYGIIIPVAEIIRFYYASSSDLSKIAFSGIYENNLHSMVGELHHMHPELDMFIIQLRKHLADVDGWTIGRLLQNHHADQGFKLIHRSLVKQSINTLGKKSVPETQFPFEGLTEWTARCLNFKSNGRNRIFILELLRCTAPFPFSDLQVIRDNDNSQNTDTPDDGRSESWPSTKVTKPQQDDLALQSEVEPYQMAGSENITLNTNRFAALDGKKIIKASKEQCKYKVANLIPCTTIQATGLGTGSGTIGASTIIPTQITIEAEDEDTKRRQREKALAASFGTMMEAVQHLNHFPDVTATVRHSADSLLIPLTSAQARQWSYLDSKTASYRSVLVADLQVKERHFWLIEFEQRKNEKCTAALIEIPQDSADEVLYRLLKSLARASGIWRNVKHQDDLKIISMKHSWKNAQGYADSVYERAI